MTGWLWILADVVGVAILGGFLFYGQRQTCAVKRPAAGLSCLPLFAQRGAVALSLYLLIDASRRIYDLGPCSGTPGDLAVPTTPTKKERSDAEQAGEPAKEGTCRTTVIWWLPSLNGLSARAGRTRVMFAGLGKIGRRFGPV